mgnify:CR=1 FL=1
MNVTLTKHKGAKRLFAVFSAVLAVMPAGVQAVEREVQGATTCSITVKTGNGSVVKGRPLFKAIDLATPFGELRIPLEALTEAVFVSSNGSTRAVLILTNKDRISGGVKMNSFRVTSPYGPLTLPTPDIKSFTIALTAAGKGLMDRSFSDELLLHYTFDEEGDALLNDSSANKHHGSRRSPARNTPDGRVNGALVCDGRTSFLAVDLTSVPAVSNLTLSAWINASMDQYSPVLEFSSNNYQYGPHLWTTPEGGLYMNFWGRPGNDRTVVTRPGLIMPHEWVHVACVYDGRRGIVYVNGEETGTQVYEGLSLEIGQPFYVGARQGWSGGNTVFTGMIDDVRVYTRALHAEEIRTLANP